MLRPSNKTKNLKNLKARLLLVKYTSPAISPVLNVLAQILKAPFLSLLLARLVCDTVTHQSLLHTTSKGANT